MLRWLADDDRGGLYGECKSKALDNLVKSGLVKLPEPLTDWGYVTLTTAGWRALGWASNPLEPHDGVEASEGQEEPRLADPESGRS